jgi:hypothetical protein
VDGLLKKYLGESANLDALPEQWAMSILPDYFVCNRHGSPAAALNFAAITRRKRERQFSTWGHSR